MRLLGKRVKLWIRNSSRQRVGSTNQYCSEHAAWMEEEVLLNWVELGTMTDDSHEAFFIASCC